MSLANTSSVASNVRTQSRWDSGWCMRKASRSRSQAPEQVGDSLKTHREGHRVSAVGGTSPLSKGVQQNDRSSSVSGTSTAESMVMRE